MRNLVFSILIGLSLQTSFGQEVRGTFLLTQTPVEIDSFITNYKIDLQHLRKTVHFLTNRDILYYQGILVPKRKKAFMRNIKHLSEFLEESYYDNRSTQKDDVKDVIIELAFYYESFIDRILSENKQNPTFKERMALGKTTRKCKKYFRFRIDGQSNPAKNLFTGDVAMESDPLESPFWHKLKEDEKPYKRFGRLANEKKIKRKKNFFILFDELSYSGSAPKVRAMDLDLDNEWSLKWGDEVHTDVVGSRIFAALGYDVDHPYFYGEDKLTLIFDGSKTVTNADQLRDSVYAIYGVDLYPFISSSGMIDKKMVKEHGYLWPYQGKPYVRFKKCAIEARPDRVKRLGSFLPDKFLNADRRELRGSLLAHAFIGNWDTRVANTLLTQVHDGDYNYRISAVFSDLGTSMGVKLNAFPNDFKVGLVNEFGWEVAILKKDKVHLLYKLNTLLAPYARANYADLYWMAAKIADLSEKDLKKIVKKAGWPDPIETLYFHKLASRRASIIKAFGLTDPHPIEFDRNLTIEEKGETIIKNGKLIVDYKRDENPESFLKRKGRFRNYGN